MKQKSDQKLALRPHDQSAAWLLLSFLILVAGLFITHGVLDLNWIWTLPASVIAFLLSQTKFAPFDVKWLMLALVVVGFALQIVGVLPNLYVQANYSYYERSRMALVPVIEGLYAVCIAGAIACVSLKSERWSNIAFHFTVFAYLTSLVVGISLCPRPWIDVWTVHEDATSALLHGQNPYAQIYANIYPLDLQKSFTPWGILFVYMPGVLYLFAPFKALGFDTRIAIAFAYASSALILKAIGKENKMPALLFLAIPFGPYTVNMAWNDAFTVTFALLYVLAMVKKDKRLFYLSIIGLALIKEHVYVCFPFMIWYGARRLDLKFWSTALKQAAISLALCVPFLIWSWRDFLGSQHGLHFLKGDYATSMPERLDSFGLLFPIKYDLGLDIPFLGPLMMLAAAAVAIWWLYKNPTLKRALAASSLVMFITIIFAPAAFLNYYCVVIAMMLAGLAIQGETA